MRIDVLEDDKDIDDVLSIAKERNLGHSLDRAGLMETRSKINHIVYILRDDQGASIGYILYTLEGEEAEIDSLAIRKEFEGHGLGSNLMESTIPMIQDIGVKRVLLEVNEENTRAIGLYKKYGFVEYRIRKGYYDGKNAICMERRLGSKDE